MNRDEIEEVLLASEQDLAGEHCDCEGCTHIRTLNLALRSLMEMTGGLASEPKN